MSKKRTIFVGVMTAVFLLSPSGAKAQGWPVFDVAKLAGLITHLAGRLQPIPQNVQRISQIKDMKTQIQATATGTISGGLKSMAGDLAKSLDGNAFSFGSTKVDKAGEEGAEAATKAFETSMFHEKGKERSKDDISETLEAREEMRELARKQLMSKALYTTSTGPEETKKWLEKIEKANEEAKSLEDKVNANTLAVIANSYERLNQLTLKLAQAEYDIADYMTNTPPGGYEKPKPMTFTEKSDYQDSFEKDEIDVDLE